jgi:hypothetical protein
VLSTVDFDHLQFEPQKIIFNRNGLPNLFAVEVQVRGKPRTLDLSSLFRRLASGVMERSNVS